jgi:hypothetical protein
LGYANTVFTDVLKLVPWNVFEQLVKTHGTDDLLRSFKTKHQFIALLFAQLSGAHSLRDIHTSMSSHRARLYHAGAVVPPRSTLADANRVRDPAVFSGLFSGAAVHRHCERSEAIQPSGRARRLARSSAAGSAKALPILAGRVASGAAGLLRFARNDGLGTNEGTHLLPRFRTRRFSRRSERGLVRHVTELASSRLTRFGPASRGLVETERRARHFRHGMDAPEAAW